MLTNIVDLAGIHFFGLIYERLDSCGCLNLFIICEITEELSFDD